MGFPALGLYAGGSVVPGREDPGLRGSPGLVGWWRRLSCLQRLYSPLCHSVQTLSGFLHSEVNKVRPESETSVSHPHLGQKELLRLKGKGAGLRLKKL